MRDSRQKGSAAGGWLAWFVAIAGAVASLVLAIWLAPRVGLAPRWGYALGFAWVCAQTLTVASYTPVRGGAAAIVLVVPAAGLSWVAFAQPAAAPAAVVVCAAWLLGASLVGAWVGARIEHPGHLLPVAVASSLADFYSVLHPAGPTAAIERAPGVLVLTALPFPMAGTTAIEPFLGAGDVVFTALYLAAARSHGLSLRRTQAALALGFAATAGCVIALERSIPALPWLGLAVVVAHPRARRLPVAEARRAAWLMVAVGALVALAFVFG